MEIITVAGNLAKIVGPEVWNELKDEFIEYRRKPHGSKVKEGAFKDCTIELAGDKAFIAVTVEKDEKGKIVWLTSDNIRSYEFVKKKKKLRKGKFKTYYYYTITFKDGSGSYVRMRKKYCKAMMKHTQI